MRVQTDKYLLYSHYESLLGGKKRAATIVLVASAAAVFPAGHMGIVFETGRSDVFFPFGKI